MALRLFRGIAVEQQLTGKLPDNDTGRDADIKTVLGSELRNLETSVAHIDHALLHAFHFVAKDDGGLGGHR